MTFRNDIINIFRGKQVNGTVFQPRLYYWYYGNGLKNSTPEGHEDQSVVNELNSRFPNPFRTVPEEYHEKSLIDIYRQLNISPRYPLTDLGINVLKNKREFSGKNIKEETSVEGDNIFVKISTPAGEIETVYEKEEHGTRIVEYPVKNNGDLRILKYFLEGTELDYEFDHAAFDIAEREFGELGVSQFSIPGKSPLQTLLVNYLGLENTIYALADYPDALEDIMELMDRKNDLLYEVLLKTPVEIWNFGENIDANLTPPGYFEKYLIPYYRKRVAQLHGAGKFCHIHMDGSLKPLLPLINDSGFDGIEAPTPKPQGDVTLEELNDAMGNTIMLDGIPAVLFTDTYSLTELEKCVTRILEIFPVNLILGVSDELPPSADIEKIKFVNKFVG